MPGGGLLVARTPLSENEEKGGGGLAGNLQRLRHIG